MISSSPAWWPIGVVDVLEAVEVEEHHREPAAGAFDPGKLLVEPFPEQEAVRQPRQRVAAEKVLRMLLARGEVARDPADIADDEKEKRDRDERAEQGQRHEPLAHEVARPLGRPSEVGRRIAGAVEDRKTDRAVARLLGCDAQAVDGVEIGEATQLGAFEPLVAGDDERLPAGAPRHRHRDGGEHGGAVKDEARDRKVAARHGAVAQEVPAGTVGGVGARRLDEVGEECRAGRWRRALVCRLRVASGRALSPGANTPVKSKGWGGAGARASPSAGAVRKPAPSRFGSAANCTRRALRSSSRCSSAPVSCMRWRFSAVKLALSLVQTMVVKTKPSVTARRVAVGQTSRDVRAP